ncbi:uncharacterized protein L969DRAFT_84046 [Mixia osmundae IAM 14324]|nr:uncharacterized protein L969DRAFT_84046 [Mixia osmundae IAM 14324]KEI42175.1 hypothetical protein L969DRAFT_84046 [Mixia osmundae IAM 14324]
MAPNRKSSSEAPPGYSIDSSVGPMYRFQKSLPQLPVPNLIETAGKYLDSVRPLVSSADPRTPDATHGGPNSAYAKTQHIVEEFVSSPLVKELQNRLRARERESENWLSDWWNEAAYMGYRDPVVPYVNYFYMHKADKNRATPALRAAGLTRALLYFRKLVETEQLEPEMVRQTPLCMSSYKYLFNACRYPVKPVDTARKFDADSHNHVIVIRKNKFYEVPIVDTKGEWLSQADLEQQYNRVIELAGQEADQHPLGALTTQNRDEWADARTAITKDPSNAKALERIESAIIVIALDDASPVTREEVSWKLWVGDGQNRFFDKHQLIVFENGKSGFNGEHSCMDGTPTSRLNDWLLRSLAAGKIDLGARTAQHDLPAPQQVKISLDTTAKTAIAKAIKDHSELMSKHRLTVLHYEGYGKNAIKKFKTSPDSWTQLVMQLAYFKMTGSLAPTYESAQTRKYKLGRTEVIRSATPEALAWCKAMEDPTVSNPRRLELLRRAGAAHVKYATWAADGQGVDRHLFGLKKCLKEGEELPELYNDPSYSLSGHWILSTSQLSSELFDCWGYSEVVPDGYGLAYSVNNNTLRFCITSMTGDVERLRYFIAEAATEVMETMQEAIEEGEGRAKL